ncbi:MAG: hypothetical protein HQL26_02690 [Candidatus Omnitrophica bacterium]|nr:hypothetical protein [Candidatus Omnitrophota bacterium]
MLIVILVIIAVISIVGLLVVSVPSLGDKKNRMVFLNEMAELLDGQLKPWEEREGAFRIFFKFQDRDFILEDILEHGLKIDVNRAYVRLAVEGSFLMTFAEMEKARIIRQEKPESVPALHAMLRKIEVVATLPGELAGLEIHTNDHFIVNQLLKEKKFLKILSQLKNKDTRGIVSMPVRFYEGFLSLDIYAKGPRQPNLLTFYTRPHEINKYFAIMIELANIAQVISKKYE